MTLKEKLDVDPAKLEAGAETDELVAECMGATQRRPDSKFWYWPDDKYSGFIPGQNQGTSNVYFSPSTKPGLAFEELWPWLVEELLLRSTNISIYTKNSRTRIRMDGKLFPDGWILSFDEPALTLCRAVVAVAKARSR